MNNKLDIKYTDLFLLSASIGFKNNRKDRREGRGREFQTNYLNSQQKTAAYSIILSDPEIGRNVEAFETSEIKLQARKRLEEFAEGGMDILVEEVSGHRWDGNTLDPTYGEYEVDLIGYIYADTHEVPF